MVFFSAENWYTRFERCPKQQPPKIYTSPLAVLETLNPSRGNGGQGAWDEINEGQRGVSGGKIKVGRTGEARAIS
jgi:hypothetical protein